MITVDSQLPTQAEMLAAYHHALISLDVIARRSTPATVRSLYLPLLSTYIGALGYLFAYDRTTEVFVIYDDDGEVINEIDVSTPGEEDDRPEFGRFVFDLISDMNQLLGGASGRRAARDKWARSNAD